MNFIRIRKVFSILTKYDLLAMTFSKHLLTFIKKIFFIEISNLRISLSQVIELSS